MPVHVFTPQRFRDARGWFTETYNTARFVALGIDAAFCQDNVSFSGERLTLRGIHFQRSPHSQAKLVRCVRGRIFDVAIDLRPYSPTFGQSVSAVLTGDDDSRNSAFVVCRWQATEDRSRLTRLRQQPNQVTGHGGACRAPPSSARRREQHQLAPGDGVEVELSAAMSGKRWAHGIKCPDHAA